MSNILQSSARSHTAPMLFSVLPDAVRNELRGETTPREYATGQVIQQRGDRPDGFYLIESGSVAVGQFLASGDFRGVALLGKGDSWGELAMFADRPRVVDALARAPSTIYHVRQALFERVLAHHPAALRPLLSALSQQLQETLDVVASIRRGSAPARLAGLLVTLSQDEHLPFRLAISQQELGELLGLTRATINKALGDFESQSLIERGYGAIRVLDRDGLAETALS